MPDSYEHLKAQWDRLAAKDANGVTWQRAALRVGETIATVGPDGYYSMTAEQWRDWALSAVAARSVANGGEENRQRLGQEALQIADTLDGLVDRGWISSAFYEDLNRAASLLRAFFAEVRT